jgi:hypothetical protein
LLNYYVVRCQFKIHKSPPERKRPSLKMLS